MKKVLKRLQERKNVLLGFLLATFLTACAGAVMIGAGCDVYARYRLEMPDLIGASKEFIQWFNILDVEMLRVCKGN